MKMIFKITISVLILLIALSIFYIGFWLGKIYEIRRTDLKRNVSYVNWTPYDFESSRPYIPGRYLIYRKKCKKMHFEAWNGNGWASSNNDCTHFTTIMPPVR